MNISLEVCEHTAVRRGVPLPMGTHESEGGVNFAIFSRHASRVRLEFFDHPEDATPARAIDLDPSRNRTGDVWHVWIEGIRAGQLYGYRVDGPYEPRAGLRFNFNKLLLDPFATAMSSGCPTGISMPRADTTRPRRRQTSSHRRWIMPGPCRNACSRMMTSTGVTTGRRGIPGRRPSFMKHMFAASPFTPAQVWSTRERTAARSEKIPYLKELGVTAVELMPVHEFNEQQVIGINPQTRQAAQKLLGLRSRRLLCAQSVLQQFGRSGAAEAGVQGNGPAFHGAGIEVILDVVFNHTAEGNERGPTLCFRGIDNAIFYMLADDKRYYKDYTGTGNTINANHPVVRDHILTALRYWVVEMHVDGFRFDLASMLGRDGTGNLLSNPPLLERIAEDPILTGTKLIAEAWDAAGAYQVGSFFRTPLGGVERPLP